MSGVIGECSSQESHTPASSRYQPTSVHFLVDVLGKCLHSLGLLRDEIRDAQAQCTSLALPLINSIDSQINGVLDMLINLVLHSKLWQLHIPYLFDSYHERMNASDFKFCSSFSLEKIKKGLKEDIKGGLPGTYDRRVQRLCEIERLVEGIYKSFVSLFPLQMIEYRTIQKPANIEIYIKHCLLHMDGSKEMVIRLLDFVMDKKRLLTNTLRHRAGRLMFVSILRQSFADERSQYPIELVKNKMVAQKILEMIFFIIDESLEYSREMNERTYFPTFAPQTLLPDLVSRRCFTLLDESQIENERIALESFYELFWAWLGCPLTKAMFEHFEDRDATTKTLDMKFLEKCLETCFKLEEEQIREDRIEENERRKCEEERASTRRHSEQEREFVERCKVRMEASGARAWKLSRLLRALHIPFQRGAYHSNELRRLFLGSTATREASPSLYLSRIFSSDSRTDKALLPLLLRWLSRTVSRIKKNSYTYKDNLAKYMDGPDDFHTCWKKMSNGRAYYCAPSDRESLKNEVNFRNAMLEVDLECIDPIAKVTEPLLKMELLVNAILDRALYHLGNTLFLGPIMVKRCCLRDTTLAPDCGQLLLAYFLEELNADMHRRRCKRNTAPERLPSAVVVIFMEWVAKHLNARTSLAANLKSNYANEVLGVVAEEYRTHLEEQELHFKQLLIMLGGVILQCTARKKTFNAIDTANDKFWSRLAVYVCDRSSDMVSDERCVKTVVKLILSASQPPRNEEGDYVQREACRKDLLFSRGFHIGAAATLPCFMASLFKDKCSRSYALDVESLITDELLRFPETFKSSLVKPLKSIWTSAIKKEADEVKKGLVPGKHPAKDLAARFAFCLHSEDNLASYRTASFISSCITVPEPIRSPFPLMRQKEVDTECYVKQLQEHPHLFSGFCKVAFKQIHMPALFNIMSLVEREIVANNSYFAREILGSDIIMESIWLPFVKWFVDNEPTTQGEAWPTQSTFVTRFLKFLGALTYSVLPLPPASPSSTNHDTAEGSTSNLSSGQDKKRTPGKLMTFADEGKNTITEDAIAILSHVESSSIPPIIPRGDSSLDSMCQQTRHERSVMNVCWETCAGYLWILLQPKEKEQENVGASESTSIGKKRKAVKYEEVKGDYRFSTLEFLTLALLSPSASTGNEEILSGILKAAGGLEGAQRWYQISFKHRAAQRRKPSTKKEHEYSHFFVDSSACRSAASDFLAALERSIAMRDKKNKEQGPQTGRISEARRGEEAGADAVSSEDEEEEFISPVRMPELNLYKARANVENNLYPVFQKQLHLVKRSDWWTYKHVGVGDFAVTPELSPRSLPFVGHWLEVQSVRDNCDDALNIIEEKSEYDDRDFKYMEVTIVRLGYLERDWTANSASPSEAAGQQEGETESEGEGSSSNGQSLPRKNTAKGKQKARKEEEGPSTTNPSGDATKGAKAPAPAPKKKKGRLANRLVGSISIGVCSSDIPEENHLGRGLGPKPRTLLSLGLTSRGLFMLNEACAPNITEELKEGDVIGVGVDFQEDIIVFTRNGTVIKVFGGCGSDDLTPCFDFRNLFKAKGDLTKVKTKTRKRDKSVLDFEMLRCGVLSLGVSICDGAIVRINGGELPAGYTPTDFVVPRNGPSVQPIPPFLFDFEAWKESLTQNEVQFPWQWIAGNGRFIFSSYFRGKPPPTIFGCHSRFGHIVADKGVPTVFADALSKALSRLARGNKDNFRPGTNGQVRDVLDPTLYPYIEGVSRFENPWAAAQLKSRMLESRKRKYYRPLWNGRDKYPMEYPETKYQLLPTNIEVMTGKAKLISYINNLDSASYGDVIKGLEMLLTLMLPLFTNVLREADRFRHCGTDDAELEHMSANLTLPPIRQVVFAVMDIVLKPGEIYEGTWAFPSLPTDQIVATGVYCVETPSSPFLDPSSSWAIEEAALNSSLLDDKGFAFRRTRNYPGQDDPLFPHLKFNERREVRCYQHLGEHQLKPGSMVAYTANAQMQIVQLKNRSRNKKAIRRLVFIHVINPSARMISTADIPEQQSSQEGTVRLLDDILNRSSRKAKSKAKEKRKKNCPERGVVPLEILLRIAEFAHPPGISKQTALSHQLQFRKEIEDFHVIVNAAMKARGLN